MERLCPRCCLPLRTSGRGKLRCPKCNTLYPREPEWVDLLQGKLYLRLRKIRWAVFAVCALLALLSLPLQTGNQAEASSNFWINVALTVCYATCLFTILHWAMYLRMMGTTLWVGTPLASAAKEHAQSLIKFALAYIMGFSVTFVAVIHDNAG